MYRVLFDFFSDNLEYGLRLASAQTSAGKPKDAQATIDALRKLPPIDANSPRIDLAEARNRLEELEAQRGRGVRALLGREGKVPSSE